MDGAWAISYVVLWVLVGLLALLLLGVIRELGGLHSRIGPPGVLMTDDGLDLGKSAPSFAAVEVPGGREVNFQPVDDRDAVLVFVSPTCNPCRKLLPSLAKGWARWERHVRIHVVCEGTEEEVGALAQATKVKIPLLADPEAGIRAGYGYVPTPFAYLVDGPTGTIQLKGIVNLGDDVDRLVVEGRARAPGGRELLRPHTDGSSAGSVQGLETGDVVLSRAVTKEVSHG